MSCDYIILPAFADLFSLGAGTELLQTILPDWYDWQSRINMIQARRLHQDGPPQEFLFSTTPPKILPFVVTNYSISHGNVTNVASTYILALNNLYNHMDFSIPGTQTVQDNLITNVSVFDNIGRRSEHRHFICLLKRMNNHMSRSQGLHLPLIWLTRRDLERRVDNPDGYTGVILDSFMRGVDDARNRYLHLTNLFKST